MPLCPLTSLLPSLRIKVAGIPIASTYPMSSSPTSTESSLSAASETEAIIWITDDIVSLGPPAPTNPDLLTGDPLPTLGGPSPEPIPVPLRAEAPVFRSEVAERYIEALQTGGELPDTPLSPHTSVSITPSPSMSTSPVSTETSLSAASETEAIIWITDNVVSLGPRAY